MKRLSSTYYLTFVMSLLVAAGCLDATTEPGGAGAVQDQTPAVAEGIGEVPPHQGRAGFIPLDVGNVWEYERVVDYVVTDDDGNVIDAQALAEDVIHEIIGTEERFGREYALNQQTFVREGGDDLHWWDRYRQDKSGLYRADIGLGEPPASPVVAGSVNARRVFHILPKELPSITLASSDPNVRRAYEAAWRRLVAKRRMIEEMLQGVTLAGPPGGPLPQETTTLRYPLRPGQEWAIRTSPFAVECAVEAREVLELPAGRMPGWRVRLENELFGPNDSVLFWYGRRGLLGELIHIEAIATDMTGRPIGTIVADETLSLQSLQLVRPGHHP